MVPCGRSIWLCRSLGTPCAVEVKSRMTRNVIVRKSLFIKFCFRQFAVFFVYYMFAKTVPTSGMKVFFHIAECRLSYAKIVQMSGIGNKKPLFIFGSSDISSDTAIMKGVKS